MSHTPGPFEFRRGVIMDARHLDVAHVAMTWGSSERTIGTVEAEANGRLLAAAPDLLAALEAVEWVQMYAPDPDGTPCRAGFTCPWCLSCLDRGHKPDCPRQLALKKARVG